MIDMRNSFPRRSKTGADFTTAYAPNAAVSFPALVPSTKTISSRIVETIADAGAEQTQAGGRNFA